MLERVCARVSACVHIPVRVCVCACVRVCVCVEGGALMPVLKGRGGGQDRNLDNSIKQQANVHAVERSCVCK